MRNLILCLMLIFSASVISAQDEQPTMQVSVDSAFVRSLPTRDAEPSASVFRNDRLEALGRNADGTWIEVRRPNREISAGWIFRDVVNFSFEVASLPITDFETGVTGEQPVYDTGFAVRVNANELVLRAGPASTADPITIIPINVVLPVLERDFDGQWLFVNYNGQTGWVAEFLTESNIELLDVPLSPQVEGRVSDFNIVSLPIIPPEVQLAQVDRLRSYITPLRDLSVSTGDFWAVLQTGEVAPCEPPESTFAMYSYTQQDIYELPELRRYIRRLETAVTDLNESITIMQACGVYTPSELSAAYANAVNATIIFNVLLDELTDLEENVIR